MPVSVNSDLGTVLKLRDMELKIVTVTKLREQFLLFLFHDNLKTTGLISYRITLWLHPAPTSPLFTRHCPFFQTSITTPGEGAISCRCVVFSRLNQKLQKKTNGRLGEMCGFTEGRQTEDVTFLVSLINLAPSQLEQTLMEFFPCHSDEF